MTTRLARTAAWGRDCLTGMSSRWCSQAAQGQRSDEFRRDGSKLGVAARQQPLMPEQRKAQALQAGPNWLQTGARENHNEHTPWG